MPYRSHLGRTGLSGSVRAWRRYRLPLRGQRFVRAGGCVVGYAAFPSQLDGAFGCRGGESGKRGLRLQGRGYREPTASGSRAARRLQTRCPERLMVPTVMVPDRGSRRPGFELSHGRDRLRAKSFAPEPRGGSRTRRGSRHQGAAFSGSWPREGRQDETVSSDIGSSRRSPETRMRIGQGCASCARSAQDPASNAGSRVTSADLWIGRQVSNGPRVVRHARSGDLRGAGREPEATAP